ncbi:MAG: hypothetical protein DMG93_17060 [Acidobacteria bacterium]|nr:MAG: hypothetical protein DMG93_17060 [Acidobacteriota bacterium]
MLWVSICCNAVERSFWKFEQHAHPVVGQRSLFQLRQKPASKRTKIVQSAQMIKKTFSHLRTDDRLI